MQSRTGSSSGCQSSQWISTFVVVVVFMKVTIDADAKHLLLEYDCRSEIHSVTFVIFFFIYTCVCIQYTIIQLCIDREIFTLLSHSFIRLKLFCNSLSVSVSVSVCLCLCLCLCLSLSLSLSLSLKVRSGWMRDESWSARKMNGRKNSCS